MRPAPTITSLNDIRAKLPRHAEAFDALVQALQNLPSISGPVQLIGAGANWRFPKNQVPDAQSVHIWIKSGATYVLQIGGYRVNGNLVSFTSAPANPPYASYSY